MRTQQSMFAFFLLTGGAVVGTTAPGALIGYRRLEERCRMGGRGSGRHGEVWSRAEKNKSLVVVARSTGGNMLAINLRFRHVSN